jgi:hypothetical protein
MRLTSSPSFGLAAVLGLSLAGLPAAPARAGFVTDPVGDTFYTGTIDITGTEVVLGGPTTTVRLRFAGAVSAASAFVPNSLAGFIDLDTAAGAGGTAPWGGPVVGGNNWVNFFTPPNPGTLPIPGPLLAMDDEFYIHLGSEFFHPGFVDVVSVATDTPVGLAPVTYAGDLVTISLPSAFIGNPTGLRYAVLVGDFLSPNDRAPNGAEGIAAEAVPAPAGAALFGLGLVSLGGVRALRRRPAA